MNYGKGNGWISEASYGKGNGWISEASMHVCKNLCTKILLIFTCLCLIIVSLAITVSPQNNQKSHSFYQCHSWNFLQFLSLHWHFALRWSVSYEVVDFHNTQFDFVPLTWTVAMRSGVWSWSSKFQTVW